MKTQDEILKQLIEEIRHGGDRKSKAHNALLIKTQSDLADEIGISIDQYKRYKSLTKLVPELQDAVQTGTITATISTQKTGALEIISNPLKHKMIWQMEIIATWQKHKMIWQMEIIAICQKDKMSLWQKHRMMLGN